MKGGIYSDQKCSVCKKSLRDNGVDGLDCADHPDERATKFKAKFGPLCNRFDTYLQARRRLEAWRQEVDDGVFDIRLYKTDSPLFLDSMIESFLRDKGKMAKKGKLVEETIKTYRRRLMRVYDHFGRVLVTDITYRAIHQWLYGDNGSVKTIHDSYCLLKEMLLWAYHMGDIPSYPRFPTWSFDPDEDMERRNTVTKAEQIEILGQVYEDQWHKSPKRYIGIKWLTTYINVRPGELLGVKEKDIDRRTGLVTIRKHKTSRRKPKHFRLTPDDLKMINSLPTGFPESYFFRYDTSAHGITRGQRFGKNAFLRTWNRACKKVGVVGVDLYGGTRHSSIVALHEEEGFSPEEIKGASGHKTMQSYYRYFTMSLDSKSKVHAAADPGFQGQSQGQRKETQ